ncbi:3-hydroxyisobutyrate dehydrogenase [Methylobacterium gregans]|uniref:Pyrroline-5-carboxylate reductase n=1 Tax=Methylobacterium gregans TaxID=374424 RepID=A0AA37HMQ3_9HYPH|nr:NAD(P)-binding domain-containing protein [Methylobacterium gregans]MDQ0523863.1 putative dinucleotide-binding enzyme [Methylobacterium gregans]GJD78171.1 Pyrroline-5-carboxylate reductase [Methylobacterium gregans]GLS54710.1 3-hydroxyisobutyrate dehydrogenase [Methylobacterium gregans]
MRSDLTRRAGLALGLALALAGPAAAEPKEAEPKIADAPMTIAVIGGGNIGGTIGPLWAKAGHTVTFASRHPEALKPLADSAGARTGTPEEAVAASDVVFLAVPYKAYPDLSKSIGPALKGKVVLDAGNATKARDGELFDAVQAEGIGATSAKFFPGAKLVRAFNAANYRVFAKNSAKNAAKNAAGREGGREGGRMAIPIAGDDPQALKVAEGLVRDAGFEPLVVGGLGEASKFAMGSPGFGHDLTAPELRAKLGLAQ